MKIQSPINLTSFWLSIVNIHHRCRLSKHDGCDVWLCSGPGRLGAYHVKEIIIDRRYLFTGSANLTCKSHQNRERLYKMTGSLVVQSLEDMAADRQLGKKFCAQGKESQARRGNYYLGLVRASDRLFRLFRGLHPGKTIGFHCAPPKLPLHNIRPSNSPIWFWCKNKFRGLGFSGLSGSALSRMKNGWKWMVVRAHVFFCLEILG